MRGCEEETGKGEDEERHREVMKQERKGGRWRESE